MSHRPGHIDNPGGGTSSMDRRKYLKALAIGTVAAAALLESCTPKAKEEEDHDHQETTPESKSAGALPWGYLSLYESDVITIDDAKKLGPPKEGENRIRIPYFNSNDIGVKQGDVVGFHLMKIGCPPLFTIAVSLIDKDHDPADDIEAMKKRNVDMDDLLIKLGYKKEPWQLPTPC